MNVIVAEQITWHLYNVQMSCVICSATSALFIYSVSLFVSLLSLSFLLHSLLPAPYFHSHVFDMQYFCNSETICNYVNCSRKSDLYLTWSYVYDINFHNLWPCLSLCQVWWSLNFVSCRCSCSHTYDWQSHSPTMRSAFSLCRRGYRLCLH